MCLDETYVQHYDKKWTVKWTIHVKSFQEGKTEAQLKYDKQLLPFVQEQRIRW
jgi:hypothetical protein